MAYKTLKQRLFAKGPKRMLSIDGGGIRGVLSLEYLKRIEAILQKQFGDDPDFRLCDYFDIIGGTSTGAVIAAGLALGFSVEKIQKLYLKLAKTVFQEKLFRFGLINAKFPKKPLVKELDKIFKDITLGSDKVRTGLMVVAKRIDTGSPWIFHNNPKGKYYNSKPDQDFYSNKDFLIKDIILASSAAPHYFEPEKIKISKDTYGVFVDGGVSAFNNPSLQMLMLATLHGYGFKWELGEKNIFLVSVGSGYLDIHKTADEIMKISALNLAAQSLLSIISDTDKLTQTMLQWMSNSQTPWDIDSEILNLNSDLLSTKPQLSYLRYETIFESKWIKQHLNMNYSNIKLEKLILMDKFTNVKKLCELGQKAASVQIKKKHFPACFNYCDKK